MKCTECNAGKLRRKLTTVEHEVRGLKFTLEDVALECDHCRFQIIPPDRIEAHARKTDQAYRHAAGYLTAAEIRQARARLGMTQTEFAEYLGVGEASLKRWELGALQDRSSDRLIRLQTDPDFARNSLHDLCRRLIPAEPEPPVQGPRSAIQ